MQANPVAIQIGDMGKKAHGLVAQLAGQCGLVKSLGLLKVGDGDFKPADCIFHGKLLSGEPGD